MSACPKSVPVLKKRATSRFTAEELTVAASGWAEIVEKGRKSNWKGWALGFDIFRISRGRCQAAILFWTYYWSEGIPHARKSESRKAQKFTEPLLPQDFAVLSGFSVQLCRRELKDALADKAAEKGTPARPPLVERMAQGGPDGYRFRLLRQNYAGVPNAPETDELQHDDEEPAERRIKGDGSETGVSRVFIAPHRNQRVTELVFGEERWPVEVKNDCDVAVSIASSITGHSLKFNLELGAVTTAAEQPVTEPNVIEIPKRASTKGRKAAPVSGNTPASDEAASRLGGQSGAANDVAAPDRAEGESHTVMAEALLFRLAEMGFATVDHDFCYRLARLLQCPATFYLELVRERKKRSTPIGKGLLMSTLAAEANQAWKVHCDMAGTRVPAVLDPDFENFKTAYVEAGYALVPEIDWTEARAAFDGLGEVTRPKVAEGFLAQRAAGQWADVGRMLRPKNYIAREEYLRPAPPRRPGDAESRKRQETMGAIESWDKLKAARR